MDLPKSADRVLNEFSLAFVKVVGEQGEYMGPEDHVREKHREVGKCEVCLRDPLEVERRTVSRAGHGASLAACRECWEMFSRMIGL